MLTAPQGSDLLEQNSLGLSSLDRGPPRAESSRSFQPGFLCPPTARHPSSGAGAIPHDAARIAPAQPGALRPRTHPGARTQPGPSTAEPRAVPPGSAPTAHPNPAGLRTTNERTTFQPSAPHSHGTSQIPPSSSQALNFLAFPCILGKAPRSSYRDRMPSTHPYGHSKVPAAPALTDPAALLSGPGMFPPRCAGRTREERASHGAGGANPPPSSVPLPSSLLLFLLLFLQPSLRPSPPSPFTLLPSLKAPFLRPSFPLHPPFLPLTPSPCSLLSLLSPFLPLLSPFFLTLSLSLHSPFFYSLPFPFFILSLHPLSLTSCPPAWDLAVPPGTPLTWELGRENLSAATGVKQAQV